MTDAFDLTGRVALVTGGNSGIGAAMAAGLAGCGATVVIWGRRDNQNRAAAGVIPRKAGSSVDARVVDVADESQVIDGMASLIEAHGRVDAVFACAGWARRLPSVLEITTEDYRSLLATNLDGAFFTLREALRSMRERALAGDPGGSLVAIGSLLTHTGIAGLTHYGIAKSGLAGLVRSLAAEAGAYGVRANLICPGYVHTPPSHARATDPEFTVTRMLSESCPIARWGQPDDFRGIACYLASDLSAYHTGDVITIDGGLLARTPE